MKSISRTPVGSEPPAGIVAGSFRLRSYRGHTVSLFAERGKVVLLSFVDTKCRESCPIVASAMAQAYGSCRPTSARRSCGF